MPYNKKIILISSDENLANAICIESDKIKYKFHQYIAGMIAFAGDIELKFQNIIPGIPVYFQNTGNLNYWLNTKFEEIDEKEIYTRMNIISKENSLYKEMLQIKEEIEKKDLDL